MLLLSLEISSTKGAGAKADERFRHNDGENYFGMAIAMTLSDHTGTIAGVLEPLLSGNA